MEVIFLRHGKSDWSVPASDRHRPLTRRGKKAATKVGEYWRCKGWYPDLILSSPATRALETANLVVTALRTELAILQQEQLYLADIDDFVEVISELKQQPQRLLIVGHNPGLEDVVEYLASSPLPDSEDGKLLTTAAFAHLLLPDGISDLRQGGARLLALQRPAALSAENSHY